MTDTLPQIKESFVQGLSQISQFWGLPKSMGAIFGVLYLSPTEHSLDELVGLTGFTKGAISTSVRTLARMGLIHRKTKLGDRKDYYVAESDFFKVVRAILKGRENSEFDRALVSVGQMLELMEAGPSSESDSAEWNFIQQRIASMQSFFDGLDSLVRVIVALENMNQNTVQKLIDFLKGQ